MGITRILAKLALLPALMAMLTLVSRADAQTATVNLGSPQGTMSGLGGCSAWSGGMSASQASTLFGQLGMGLWRVRISPDGNNAVEAGNVAIAHSYGAKVLATPWSPPANLKSNGSTIQGSLPAANYGAYATYLNNSMATLHADYVSLQNEPDYVPRNYEGCGWSNTQIRDFLIQQGANITTPICIPESAYFRNPMADASLDDPVAVTHVALVGGHLYGGGPATFMTSNGIAHGKPVWETEHQTGDASVIGNAIAAATEISSCINVGMTGYIWWYTYFAGNSSNLIQGDNITLTGYVFGQWGRFVRPGYVKVSATYAPQTNVQLTAYTGGGNAVVVAVNSGTSAISQPIAFSGGTVSSVTPHRTSATEYIAQQPSIGVSGGSFTATLPAQSVTTFVGNLGGANACLAVPAAPTALAAPTVAWNSATLTWNGSSPTNCTTSRYTVYRNGTAIATTVANTLTVPNLSPSTTYSFAVSATNSFGTGSASNAINVTTPAIPVSGPFGGTPAALPGTVSGVNYDTGGPDVGYHVDSAGGTSNSYRVDGVDIEACGDTIGNGYDLGWTAAGNWFKYTVNVAAAGTYSVRFRCSSPNGTNPAFHVENAAGANLTGSVAVRRTSNWQKYVDVNVNMTLPAGVQTLKLVQENGGWNFNLFSF